MEQTTEANHGSTAAGSRLGRRIDIPSVPNLRDIGGYPVAGGGRVRTGLLYRSVELNHLASDDDLEAFAELGIRTVFDMRTAAERAAEPDLLPDGTELVVCDVLKDSQSAAPAALMKVLSDPALAEQMLGDGKAVQMFEKGYREIVSLPSAISQTTPTGRRCSTVRRARTAQAGPLRRRYSCSACPQVTSNLTTS